MNNTLENILNCTKDSKQESSFKSRFKHNKTSVYLFDWGDTLMVDFPTMKGKMCDWPSVKTVEHAYECLQALSENSLVFIATGAADSSVSDIEKAFKRTELSPFIDGVFCKDNLGVSKGEPEFLHAILNIIGDNHQNIYMVGDNITKDILPTVPTNITPIWFNQNGRYSSELLPNNVKIIANLLELIEHNNTLCKFPIE